MNSVVESTTATPEGRNYEAEAREAGWLPQEQWKGDTSKWRDAKTFVERGENFLPLVNAKLRRTEQRLAAAETTITDLREGNRRFLEFHEQTREATRKQYEDRIAALEGQRAQAITDGDGPRAVAVEREIRSTERQLEQSRQSGGNGDATQQLQPDVQQWLNDNRWYNSDPDLKAVADGLTERVARENPGLQGRAFLDKLAERVKQVAPQRFQTEAAGTPSFVDTTAKSGSLPSQGGTKARTYENLPADAKAACDQFVRTIPKFTREKYLAEYRWESVG